MLTPMRSTLSTQDRFVRHPWRGSRAALYGAVLALALFTTASAQSPVPKAHSCGGECPMHQQSDAGAGPGMHQGMKQGMKKGMGGEMRGGGPPAVMHTAMELVHQYRGSIEREIQNIDNGVITITRSATDPEAARTLEQHVREMKDLIASGDRIRDWDPLFSEIFDHYEQIDMQIETIEGGVKVTETSADPDVVLLIQAHAQKVSQFLARGPEAVHEATPLPEGYEPKTNN